MEDGVWKMEHGVYGVLEYWGIGVLGYWGMEYGVLYLREKNVKERHLSQESFGINNTSLHS